MCLWLQAPRDVRLTGVTVTQLRQRSNSKDIYVRLRNAKASASDGRGPRQRLCAAARAMVG